MFRLPPVFRTLLRAPAFSLVVILTLSVGIGANTVVFSGVDGTILNPFPYPEAYRLVGVGTVFPRLNRGLGSPPTCSRPSGGGTPSPPWACARRWEGDSSRKRRKVGTPWPSSAIGSGKAGSERTPP